MNDLTFLIEISIDKLLGKMILIPIGAVEKTNVLVLRSILSRLLSGSQKGLKKADAVLEWKRLVSEYELKLKATFSEQTEVSRQVLTADFMDKIKDSPIEIIIKTLIKNLDGLAVSTVASEMTWFRNFLKANSDYPNAKDLDLWSYEFGRPFSIAKNKEQNRRLSNQLEEIKSIKVDSVREWVETRKDSAKWQDISYVIALCTGRRMIEIHGDATFTPISEDKIHFTGQAKKRGEDRNLLDEGFEIPVIFITASEVAKLIEKLETQDKRIENPDNKIVNKTFSMALSRQPSPLTQYKEARDFYSAYLIENGYNGNTHPAKYLTRVLGHKPGETGVSGSALNYQKLRLV